MRRSRTTLGALLLLKEMTNHFMQFENHLSMSHRFLVCCNEGNSSSRILNNSVPHLLGRCRLLQGVWLRSKNHPLTYSPDTVFYFIISTSELVFNIILQIRLSLYPSPFIFSLLSSVSLDLILFNLHLSQDCEAYFSLNGLHCCLIAPGIKNKPDGGGNCPIRYKSVFLIGGQATPEAFQLGLLLWCQEHVHKTRTHLQLHASSRV